MELMPWDCCYGLGYLSFGSWLRIVVVFMFSSLCSFMFAFPSSYWVLLNQILLEMISSKFDKEDKSMIYFLVL